MATDNRLFIEYAADPGWDYKNGTNLPNGTEDGWVWEDRYIPVSHAVGEITVGPHKFQRIKVGANGTWSFPQKISGNSIVGVEVTKQRETEDYIYYTLTNFLEGGDSYTSAVPIEIPIPTIDADNDVLTRLNNHIADTDIHFSDAPFDGNYYSRRNNAWEILNTDSYTFENGITNDSNTIKLGGALTGNTEISGLDTYTLLFTGGPVGYTANYSGSYNDRSFVDRKYVQDNFGNVFTVTANLISNSLGDYANDSFVVGSPSMNDNGVVANDSRMFFDKANSCFRMGYVDGTQWNTRGYNSVAMGYNNTATGSVSMSFGHITQATGYSALAAGFQTQATDDYTTALGYLSNATQNGATAIGRECVSSGNSSLAAGFGASAYSRGEVSIGAWNTTYTPSGVSAWVLTDRLFTIGNGADSGNRSDVLTILKNGQFTIGSPVDQALLTNQPTGTVDLAIATTKYVDDSITGAALTFTNGLTETSGTVKLGGTITEATTISNPSVSTELKFEGVNSGEGVKRTSLIIDAIDSKLIGTEDGNSKYQGIIVPIIGTSAKFIGSDGTNTSFLSADDTGALIFQSSFANWSGVRYAADYSADYTSLSLVHKGYVDGLIDSNLKSPDSYDASVGTYPTNYKSTGTVAEGDTFYITVSGTMGTTVVNVGDLLVARTDTPAQIDANWFVVESNRDQATETILGVSKIATQAITNIGTNDTDYVTPLKLKEYLVDQGIQNLVFNQGLTETAGTVSLGGTLDGNIGLGLTEINFINTAYLAFNIGTNSDVTFGNNRISATYNDSTYEGLNTLRPDRQSFSTRHIASARQGAVSLLSTATASSSDFRVTGNGGFIGLTLTAGVDAANSSGIIEDTINSKGWEYAADYSTNFTLRSLVDKEYVDGAITAAGLTFSNGLVENAGNVTLGGSITSGVGIEMTSTFGITLEGNGGATEYTFTTNEASLVLNDYSLNIRSNGIAINTSTPVNALTVIGASVGAADAEEKKFAVRAIKGTDTGGGAPRSLYLDGDVGLSGATTFSAPSGDIRFYTGGGQNTGLIINGNTINIAQNTFSTYSLNVGSDAGIVSTSGAASINFDLTTTPWWRVGLASNGEDFEIYNKDITDVAITVSGASNHVGIGHGSPAAPLDVLNPASNETIRIRSNAASGNSFQGSLTFVDSVTSTQGYVGYRSNLDGVLSIFNNNNANISFGTNGTEAVIIDNNGNLGVGVSPQAALDVSGKIRNPTVANTAPRSGTITIDFDNHREYYTGLLGTATITPTNGVPGDVQFITVTGNQTLNFSAQCTVLNGSTYDGTKGAFIGIYCRSVNNYVVKINNLTA